jgi:UDP-N-acetylglucosamine 2-epimerase (non-hydrolysing)
MVEGMTVVSPLNYKDFLSLLASCAVAISDSGGVQEEVSVLKVPLVGWWVNKVLGRTTITKWQARVFGFMLPIARLAEGIKVLPGLSVVAIARRP